MYEQLGMKYKMLYSSPYDKRHDDILNPKCYLF